MIGQTLGHYRIEAKLGEGGMGVVYKARDTHLDRPVAIKVLRAEAVADPERRRRFVQEAKADGVDYIVMEYVAGESLNRKIPRRGLPLAQALGYAVEIADALAAAHAAGIVHRDLKPAIDALALLGERDFVEGALQVRVPLRSAWPGRSPGP